MIGRLQQGIAEVEDGAEDRASAGSIARYITQGRGTSPWSWPFAGRRNNGRPHRLRGRGSASMCAMPPQAPEIASSWAGWSRSRALSAPRCPQQITMPPLDLAHESLGQPKPGIGVGEGRVIGGRAMCTRPADAVSDAVSVPPAVSQWTAILRSTQRRIACVVIWLNP